MPRTDRDPTDQGLVDVDALLRSLRSERWGRVPRPPRPKPPATEPGAVSVPSQRAREHIRRIDTLMGWRRDPRKRAPCGTCYAGPGKPCVTPAGRRMSGLHEGRGEG